MIFILIILFVLVVLASFLLAFYSMKDFHTKPNPDFEYALFLVRSDNGLKVNALSAIFAKAAERDLLISLERLFKGDKKAWVIYGPKKILLPYKEDLGLLELEDYTDVDINNIAIWEVAIKNVQDFKEKLPKLLENEQFWFQIILKLKGKDLHLIPAQLRFILLSQDADRLKELTENTQKNFENLLPKLPKPFSKSQLFEFYKTRSLIKENGREVKLKVEEVLNLGFFL